MKTKKNKQGTVTIFVGLYRLLPKEHYGYEGVMEMTRNEVRQEVRRQQATLGPGNPDAMDSYTEEKLIGEYDAALFEETFNNDLHEAFNTADYWIRIFN